MNHFFDPNKHHKNTHAFLSNKHVVLELNTLIHFPYENAVGILFYLKSGTIITNRSISLNLLKTFIGVDIEEGTCKRVLEKYLSSRKEPQDTRRRVYFQESLKFINNILINVFS